MHPSLVPQTPTRTHKEGLVTLCTTSCSKLWNVARPIRSLGLQSALHQYVHTGVLTLEALRSEVVTLAIIESVA